MDSTQGPRHTVGIQPLLTSLDAEEILLNTQRKSASLPCPPMLPLCPPQGDMEESVRMMPSTMLQPYETLSHASGTGAGWGTAPIQTLRERCSNQKVKGNTCSVRRTLQGQGSSHRRGDQGETHAPALSLARQVLREYCRQREHCPPMPKARQDNRCLRKFKIMQRKDRGVR